MASLSFTKLVGVMMLAAGAFALPQRIESLAMMDVSGQASSLASSLKHSDCTEESAKPFKEGGECVDQCDEGRAPDAKGICKKCEDDTPFADHMAHKCVKTCPAGAVGNADTNECVATCPTGHARNNGKDCEKCEDDTFADHVAHKCVETCPSGYAGNKDNNDCEIAKRVAKCGCTWECAEDGCPVTKMILSMTCELLKVKFEADEGADCSNLNGKVPGIKNAKGTFTTATDSAARRLLGGAHMTCVTEDGTILDPTKGTVRHNGPWNYHSCNGMNSMYQTPDASKPCFYWNWKEQISPRSDSTPYADWKDQSGKIWSTSNPCRCVWVDQTQNTAAVAKRYNNGYGGRVDRTPNARLRDWISCKKAGGPADTRDKGYRGGGSCKSLMGGGCPSLQEDGSFWAAPLDGGSNLGPSCFGIGSACQMPVL